jgi:signal transduction histidine kinase
MNLTDQFPWRRVQLAFVVVVISFVGATAVADRSLHAIDRAASVIAQEASPRIQSLASARAELRRVQAMALLSVQEEEDGEDTPTWGQVMDARGRLSEQIVAYRSLPDPAPQARIRERIRTEEAALDDALARISSRAREGDRHEARVIARGDLVRAADGLSAALLDGVEQDASLARALALRIEATRSRARGLSIALDGVCALFAVAAGVAVLSASRKFATLVEAHARLLKSRADELETFAARVAHDILSPLGSVSIALELGAKGLDASDPKRRRLGQAQAALLRVRRIVDDLLTFARAGARSDPRARTDLRPVIEDVVESVRPQAEAAGVELTTDLRGTGAVRCSAGLLASVMGNLLGNAIKYIGDSPQKRVRVQAERDGDRVRISVEDTGPGVPGEHAKTVFDPYVRGPEAKVPGIGLGLATVRRVIEAHGGTVGVTSEVGEGARFWVELPVAVDA